MELFTTEELETLSNSIAGTPIWQHWDRFVNIRRLSERSQTTIRNIRDSIRYFALFGTLSTMESWMDENAIFEAHKVKQARKWSNCTFNTHRKNVGMYFGFLVEDGKLPSNPAKKIRKMPQQRKNYDLPSEEDFVAIIRYLRMRRNTNEMERRRNLLFFGLLAETGARPKELLDLRLSDVANRADLMIQGIKGGKPRAFPLSETLKVLLRDYIFSVAQLGRDGELDKHLFLGVKGRKGWTYTGLRKLFERVNRESGVTSRLTAYSFRRGAITSMLVAGMPIEQVMKFAGHGRSSTTMIYYQGVPGATEQGVKFMNEKYGNAFL